MYKDESQSLFNVTGYCQLNDRMELSNKRPASNPRLQVSCLLAGLLLVATVSARRFRVHVLFL